MNAYCDVMTTPSSGLFWRMNFQEPTSRHRIKINIHIHAPNLYTHKNTTRNLIIPNRVGITWGSLRRGRSRRLKLLHKWLRMRAKSAAHCIPQPILVCECVRALIHMCGLYYIRMCFSKAGKQFAFGMDRAMYRQSTASVSSQLIVCGELYE